MIRALPASPASASPSKEKAARADGARWWWWWRRADSVPRGRRPPVAVRSAARSATGTEGAAAGTRRLADTHGGRAQRLGDRGCARALPRPLDDSRVDWERDPRAVTAAGHPALGSAASPQRRRRTGEQVWPRDRFLPGNELAAPQSIASAVEEMNIFAPSLRTSRVRVLSHTRSRAVRRGEAMFWRIT